jgi:hypothetical protein
MSNMDEPPVDLSPLDPSRDRARWDRLVASVAARARARRPSFAQVLVRGGVPAFALAAAAALAVWIARPAPRAPAPVTRDAADAITGWAYGASADPFALVYGGSDAGR